MSEYGSLDMYKIMKAMYDNGFDGYIRPDHGRMIWEKQDAQATVYMTEHLEQVILMGFGRRLRKRISK